MKPDHNTHVKIGRWVCVMILLFSFTLVVVAQVSSRPHAQAQSNGATAAGEKEAGDSKPPTPGTHRPQKLVHEGVEVEFTIDPIAAADSKPEELMEGQDAVVQFKITESRNGTPLTNLHPSAWMDLRLPGKLNESQDCRQKIQSFLQAALSARPEIDLNTYYILALNDEANISVIDPLLGYGNSKLLTFVFLKSPGEDWVLSGDKKRLFVTMPAANQVAVVDTSTWRVLTNIDTGARPSKIVLQPDQKYLWVGTDSGDDSGVTVIDTGDLKPAARLKTGAGHHEIELSADSRFAYVTNLLDGTLSVIDVGKLVKLKDIKTGGHPVSLAFSALSKSVYVASQQDGTITVVGGEANEILARITTKPGLKSIRFVPEGRYGFAVNAKENNVQVFDASTNQIVHVIAVEKNPDKVTFTDNYAYVRSLASDQISMIRLDAISKKGEVPVLDFPGGQLAPQTAPGASTADVITPAPEGNAVLVANPADKIIYYYAEGMAAPMGSFQNYRREPRAVMVWDRSLRETKPGVYSTNIKVTASGDYDVAFLLDTPRIAHCFSAAVKPNPLLAREPELPIYIAPLVKDRNIRVGEAVKLQFLVTDSKTTKPKDGLKDFGVLVFLAPGQWQKRLWAQSIGEGKYEVSFTADQPGPYYVFVQCPSLKVRYNQAPHFILLASDQKPAASDEAAPKPEAKRGNSSESR